MQKSSLFSASVVSLFILMISTSSMAAPLTLMCNGKPHDQLPAYGNYLFVAGKMEDKSKAIDIVKQFSVSSIVNDFTSMPIFSATLTSSEVRQLVSNPDFAAVVTSAECDSEVHAFA